jgi:hypothetical protein
MSTLQGLNSGRQLMRGLLKYVMTCFWYYVS